MDSWIWSHHNLEPPAWSRLEYSRCLCRHLKGWFCKFEPFSALFWAKLSDSRLWWDQYPILLHLQKYCVTPHRLRLAVWFFRWYLTALLKSCSTWSIRAPITCDKGNFMGEFRILSCWFDCRTTRLHDQFQFPWLQPDRDNEEKMGFNEVPASFCCL